ncbi:hypothetical protein Dimus_007106 [Dionaea muscipula]
MAWSFFLSFFLLLKVTKRVDTAEEAWKDWNWRSEGDITVNGAFFVASGEGLEVKYEKAYSVEPKSVAYIDQITMNAGVFGSRLVGSSSPLLCLYSSSSTIFASLPSTIHLFPF